MSDPKAKAEELKIQGNQSLNVSAFWSAIEQYTEALKLDPDNAAIYTNRSLAYARSGKMDLALEDAEKAVELKPTWVKAYMRKGQALQGLKFYEEAMLAYQEGLKHEPNHTTMLQGVKECQDQLTGPSGSQPLGHPFSSPDLWDKISHNPTTREYLTDPKYKEMITQIQNDPKKFSEYAMDPRIMNTIGVLIGADLSMFDGSGGSNLPDPAEQERMKEQAAKKHEAMKEVQKNLEQKMDKVRDEVEGMILKVQPSTGSLDQDYIINVWQFGQHDHLFV